MIDVQDTITGLKKMLRLIDRDIGISAALRDEEMRENAEWRRGIVNSAIVILEGSAAKP